MSKESAPVIAISLYFFVSSGIRFMRTIREPIKIFLVSIILLLLLTIYIKVP